MVKKKKGWYFVLHRQIISHVAAAFNFENLTILLCDFVFCIGLPKLLNLIFDYQDDHFYPQFN